MLKIVIFDCGYGGELFAYLLGQEYPGAKIIKVIDRDNSAEYRRSAFRARKFAKRALAPYINDADVIVLANIFLTTTSLSYFRQKFRHQKFVGMFLTDPGTFKRHRHTLVLTDKIMLKTITFHRYLRSLGRKVDVLTTDEWIKGVDEGNAPVGMIGDELNKFIVQKGYTPDEVILASGSLNDIKPAIYRAFGRNTKIYDSFHDTYCEVGRALKIRGGAIKKIKHSQFSNRIPRILDASDSLSQKAYPPIVKDVKDYPLFRTS